MCNGSFFRRHHWHEFRKVGEVLSRLPCGTVNESLARQEYICCRCEKLKVGLSGASMITAHYNGRYLPIWYGGGQ